MGRIPRIDSSKYSDLTKVIGWFITLRWIACVGVLISLLVVNLFLEYQFQFPILYGLNGLLCVANLVFTVYFRAIKKRNLSHSEMIVFFNVQICCDYVLLFLVVYFTGFLENPFTFYFVFHVMLTSFIFSADVLIIYVGALIAVFAGVMVLEYYHIVPHYSLSGSNTEGYFRLIGPRMVGLCSTLGISAYLISSIKQRLEEKGAKVEVELNRYMHLDKLKSNFILQVTHELRGPIAAMNGYHEMILRGVSGEVNAKTMELVRKANRRTGNLLTIIDEMIDFAYMKSEDELKYERTELNMKEVIDGNFDVFMSFAEQRNIELIAICPQELTLSSNRDLLNIVFSNLINNAIKYSPEHTKIIVEAYRENNEIHLVIKDQGYGIEPPEMDKIFEEFYRARKARELERDGTGLGLSIVKRAIEVLKGRMTVYSEVNEGTAFHIFFPVDGGGNG